MSIRLVLSLTMVGILLALAGCSSFKAQRVDSEKSDEKAMEITNKWVSKDTQIAIQNIMKQMEAHKGFQRYMAKRGGKPPRLFVSNVVNDTSEASFPINDMNDELLNQLSATGEYELIDPTARQAILDEIKYQNDGMVDPTQAASVGKQHGAELMIFGTVHMDPAARDGKTIKEYMVNIRMVDVETAVEVLRTRTQVNKYSEQSGSGW